MVRIFLQNRVWLIGFRVMSCFVQVVNFQNELKLLYLKVVDSCRNLFRKQPGDFRSWESPQTLPALFIGSFEHVERFRNLKFAVKSITNIQSTVISSSEGTAAIYLAFK